MAKKIEIEYDNPFINRVLSEMPEEAKQQMLVVISELFNCSLDDAKYIVNESNDPAERQMVQTYLYGYTSGVFNYLNNPIPDWYYKGADPCTKPTE